MRSFNRTAFAAAVAVASLAAMPAFAQKSKDTVRFTLDQVIPTLDPYLVRGNQMTSFANVTYGHLVVWDERNQKYLPELAKSWSRPSPNVLEFELRDDITFTSGNKFSADDVKYIVEYLIDPKLKISFKQRYSWVKSVDVLSPTKVRITSKKRIPDDLMNLAYWFFILDSKIHSGLKDKADYGQKYLSGTSIYKAVSVDKNDGVRLTLRDDMVGKFAHLRAGARNFHAIPIHEQQVRLASLLTGKVDVFLDPTTDIIEGLKDNPNFKFSVFPSRYLIYIFLDAAGRSKEKLFTDKRVREAFFKAIDRDAIINTYVRGGEYAARPDAVCFKEVLACKYSTKPLGYDPEGAKKLLAEAGYPDGVDFTFYHNYRMGEISEAIAGQLRKVGFRPKLYRVGTIGLQIKMRGRGELTTFAASYPNFAEPSANNIMALYFGGNRDYSKDPVILQAYKKGVSEMDPVERAKIYEKAFDRVNEMSYIYPLSEWPNVYVHHKDLVMKPGLITIAETRPTDFFWAK